MAKAGKGRRRGPLDVYQPNRGNSKPKTLLTDAPKGDKRLAGQNVSEWGATKSGRMLQMIRRDMDVKESLFRNRRRYEEVLSLAYQDATAMGGSPRWQNLRENALNLPYRYVRWLESQATSKTLIVKTDRGAGAGQMGGSGPGDEDSGEWVDRALERVAEIAGFRREMKAGIGEICPRGTTAFRIGYHDESITVEQQQEVGKDPQSVIPEALMGDAEAKPGQAHSEISAGLAVAAEDPLARATIGQEGVAALVARKDSHDQADYEQETDTFKSESTRLKRHRIWIQKLRVGEECGWTPNVSDTESASEWWQRHVDTVAWVKRSPLFSDEFKAKVQGYDSRTASGVFSGGRMPSEENMGSDARQAQAEDNLDDDEKLVEWFEVWCRYPDMKSGGLRKIVCAETPEMWAHASDANPHVFPPNHPLAGQNEIPGFFPFYDFTPIQSSLPVPERTCGLPPIAVGMPIFEQIAECIRIIHESALRHSLRLYEIDPAVKDAKKVQDALRRGDDGFSFIASQAQVGMDGRLRPGVVPIQFTGNTMEVERVLERLISMWIQVMAMPPAVLNGMGTAKTATQDQQGISAGERESGAIVEYMEDRTGDMLAGVRGLMRGCFDDEDFHRLVGAEGAAALKAWQIGTVDDGDRIEVTFGATAQAKETVDRKQIMEAITLLASQVDPLTGQPKYDVAQLVEELHRSLGLGSPKFIGLGEQQLRQLVMVLMQKVQQLTAGPGAEGGQPGGPPKTSSSSKPPSGGPNPSEGDGPSEGTLASGAMRDTVLPVAG